MSICENNQTITLPIEIHELGVIKCKEPIKIWIYHIDEDGVIYYQWDIGMDGYEFKKDSPFLDINNIEKVEDKVQRMAQYDLAHAFFHYKDDPNYTHYHWALYGNYKDRVILEEY